ncbi:hypothetical protein CR513_12219, partial [Mucuna pruriens]
MVLKSNGRWRMCIDYTNLNKVCPKDPYPLPSMDRLVDDAFGHGLLSFMNAYSRCNQIRMHPMGEDKIALRVVSAIGDHLLEIDGPNIQRSIGLDLEVYVDNMVVKLAQGEQHCVVLTRIFDVLRKHKLKLNLEKCSFNVQAKKFLGYILTRRGIEANSNKCEPVINMRSPTSIKEI